MPLKRGDRVMIYEDPFSQFKPEGIATLISKESSGPDGEEQWLVQFIGETEIYSRCIYNNQQ